MQRAAAERDGGIPRSCFLGSCSPAILKLTLAGSGVAHVRTRNHAVVVCVVFRAKTHCVSARACVRRPSRLCCAATIGLPSCGNALANRCDVVSRVFLSVRGNVKRLRGVPSQGPGGALRVFAPPVGLERSGRLGGHIFGGVVPGSVSAGRESSSCGGAVSDGSAVPGAPSARSGELLVGSAGRGTSWRTEGPACALGRVRRPGPTTGLGLAPHARAFDGPPGRPGPGDRSCCFPRPLACSATFPLG